MAINVIDHGAVPDGITDNTDAFRNAYNAIPPSGGSLYIPSGLYLFDFSGVDVILNPKVVLSITKSNIDVYGEGRSSILIMKNITTSQLNSGSDDPNAAGNDVATLLAFTGCTDCSVRNVKILGDGGTTPIIVGKARAKGISIYNSHYVVCSDIVGRDIPGNVINIRGSTGSYYCSIRNSIASGCSENGFNLMGGTFFCSVKDTYSIDNQYHGIESGVDNLMCYGNYCRGNKKTGISQVGDYGLINNNVVSDNQFAGINIQWNNSTYSGSSNVVSCNVTMNQSGSSSVGILIDENVDQSIIHGNYIFSEVEGIKLAGIPVTSPVVNSTIINNFIKDESERMSYGINLIHSDNTLIRHNIIRGARNRSVIGQAQGDSLYMDDNIIDSSFSDGSMTNVFTYDKW